MSERIFGAGNVVLTPLSDAFGNAIAVPTPILIGTMQDVSIDVSFDLKPLHGANQFAEEYARGKGKMAVKIKNGNVQGGLWNSTFFGQTLGTGQFLNQVDLVGQVVPATPFQITVVPPQSGVFSQDLSVSYLNAIGVNIRMVRVASAPITGQYTVTPAGLYTFAAADTAKTVFINYQYTVTTGYQSIVQNVPMGAVPIVKLDFFMNVLGKQTNLTFFRAFPMKLMFATKLDDWGIPEMDFECAANGGNQAMAYTVAEL